MSGPTPAEPGTDDLVWLTHVNVRLALHRLRAAEGRPLLLLHGLGERTPHELPRSVAAWPGPIWGLDLTGHGRSTVPCGGGYTAEVLMADVDQALAHLGPVTVLGRGLGAYLALLIGGARAALVRGVILTDGPGLAGGGPSPHSPFVVALGPSQVTGEGPATAPDPFVLVEMANDIRPPDYATTYVRQAVQFSGLDTPVAVTGVVRPPWLTAVVDEPGVTVSSLPDALARYAALD